MKDFLITGCTVAEALGYVVARGDHGEVAFIRLKDAELPVVGKYAVRHNNRWRLYAGPQS